MKNARKPKPVDGWAVFFYDPPLNRMEPHAWGPCRICVAGSRKEARTWAEGFGVLAEVVRVRVVPVAPRGKRR